MDNLRVLIAGTSSSHLEISKKMLKYHYENCKVDFANSGNECIDKAATNNYSLVLFDFELGDKNGFEVIGLLKALGNNVSLVMLVDEGDEDKGIRAVAKGASDYIVKSRGYLTALPFTIKSFIETDKPAEQPDSNATLEPTNGANGKESHFVLDRKGRIISANLKMEKMTDYSEDELLELNLVDLLPKDKEKLFFEWMNLLDENGNSDRSFQTNILGKKGSRHAFKLVLTPVKDDKQRVISYRGRMQDIPIDSAAEVSRATQVDQLDMINKICDVITTSYEEPLSIFLEKVVEAACQIFRFQRSTLALLDKRKKVFVKQSMIGYGKFAKENIEVPKEVIERIFTDRFRVKVIYYNQDHRNRAMDVNSQFPERRTQLRRPENEWHRQDLVLVKLMNRNGSTFGYISLDNPVPATLPIRDTFHNLELFGQIVSMAIENFYQFSSLEKNSRRLKQILVTSNIFKLHLSLNELLKEVVWSIKFSLDFNLVALGLISKRSSHLEIKAVACEDKIKLNQLSELNFPLNEFANLFSAENNLGKSYFVASKRDVLRPLKQVYYGPNLTETNNGNWPTWGTLLVPIRSQEGKIIGVLMADDPANHKMPAEETVRTLEILANQVAVAIDNRVLYVQTKSRLKELQNLEFSQQNASGFRKLFDRVFK